MHSENSRKKFQTVGVLGGLLAIFFAYAAFADVTGDILPSADGAYASWTPSAGTAHYALVDESSCNGTTDYVYTTAVGNRDAYKVSLSSVPNYSTITGVHITPCASRNSNGGGSSTMNVFYRFNGTDSSDAGNYALTGTTPVALSTTAWSGLSLAKVSTSAMEIGAVLSAGTKGARLSRMAVTFD